MVNALILHVLLRGALRMYAVCALLAAGRRLQGAQAAQRPHLRMRARYFSRSIMCILYASYFFFLFLALATSTSSITRLLIVICVILCFFIEIEIGILCGLYYWRPRREDGVSAHRAIEIRGRHHEHMAPPPSRPSAKRRRRAAVSRNTQHATVRRTMRPWARRGIPSACVARMHEPHTNPRCPKRWMYGCLATAVEQHTPCLQHARS
jgi:hypothetical protein